MNSDKMCLEEGCEQKLIARGLCSVHYHVLRKAGLPPLPKPTAIERFLSGRVNDSTRTWNGSSCIVWKGSHTRGYGTMMVEGKQQYVHRVAWEHFVGPIPTGLQIDHLCRNTSCSNVAHLEPVTPQVNVLRAKQAQEVCKRGHAWTVETTRWISQKDGRKTRLCRACAAERDAGAYLRYKDHTKAKRVNAQNAKWHCGNCNNGVNKGQGHVRKHFPGTSCGNLLVVDGPPR